VLACEFAVCEASFKACPYAHAYVYVDLMRVPTLGGQFLLPWNKTLSTTLPLLGLEITLS
jgi:hypothetical protein